ncbi:MAG: carotenoid oxygenase family protein [Polyangiaceae bacterium]|nr:carotenoid oxygenase family protein [Polyangiaceae bacterium]
MNSDELRGGREGGAQAPNTNNGGLNAEEAAGPASRPPESRPAESRPAEVLIQRGRDAAQGASVADVMVVEHVPPSTRRPLELLGVEAPVITDEVVVHVERFTLPNKGEPGAAHTNGPGAEHVQARSSPKGAEAQPSPNGAEARPAGGAEARPAGGAEARPAGGAEARPAGGAEARPAGGAEARPALDVGVLEAPSTMSLEEFGTRVEKALLHIYHGDVGDRRVSYVVKQGQLPSGLSGRTYTTVFSYESVMAGPGLAAAPNMLTAPARLLTMDFSSGEAGNVVPVATTTIQNEAWHLRALAPNAFVRSDFAEFSWFGISNLSNTCAIPVFAASADGRPQAGVRLLLSYDAGRPIEVNPETLEYVTPVGRATNYHAAVGSLFGPMIMTTGHPVYDPDFDRGRPRLIYTNLVPRVTSFFTFNTPVSADLYLVTWDGGQEGPTPPLRVCEGGKPVVLAQASAHQICLTANYVVVMQATLVLDTASLLKPLSPLLRQQIARAFGGRVPRPIDKFDDTMSSYLKAAVQPSHTDLFFIAKSDLRKALGSGSGSVEAKRVRLDWEATHAVADHDDRGGVITLYCQHNVGADPADQIEPGDELLYGGTANRDLEGMFSGSTDLNQVRKYVIDAKRGHVLSMQSFPDPASDEDFAFGLNLLPPTQVLPYRPDHPEEPYNQVACTRSWDCTFWVSGGWAPATSLRRVFERYREARLGQDGKEKRLVPYEDYCARIADVRNSVRFFRLDRDLKVESSYVFEPGVLMGSPTFVPREGARSVRDGFLVGPVWRHDHPSMEVWIWDAAGDFSKGPICVLGSPPGEPGLRPGFPLHGCWVEEKGVANWEKPAYQVASVEVPPIFKWAEALTATVTAAKRLVQQLLIP